MNTKKIDMTQGSIIKKVLLFAIPIVIGNILQQLYTTVDTLVIGKYCDTQSLAAVGTSSQPVEVLLCIFLGIGTGASIIVSQYVGSKDTAKLKELCKSAVYFVYLVSIPLTVLGFFFAPFMLRIMRVPEDTMVQAVTYTRFIFFGTIASIGYNMNAGVLRGLGDSIASLLFLVVSCIMNIVLDYLFVAGFNMGVGGAALSTSVAQLVSWIVSIIYIRKKFPELEFRFFTIRYSKVELKKIFSMGMPIGLNNSMYSIGHVVLQVMVNAQGSLFMAGASVAGRVTGLSNIAITALSAAATTFSGQNYGAKRYDRLKEGHLRIPIMSGLITLSFGLLFISFRTFILKFFTDDEMVLLYASRYVFIMLLSQWLYAVFNCIICIANGIGQVKYTMVVNLLMLYAVRIPAAYLIMRFFDGTYVMLAYPISFAFGMICMFGYYLLSKKWKEIMRLAETTKGPGN